MWWILLFIQVVGGAPAGEDGYEEIRQTITALDDVISWAKAHHYLLIVDFLFSIRVVQGELEMLTERSDNWAPEIRTRLQVIQEKADRLAHLAFDNPSLENTEYYKNFLPLISQKYRISQKYSSKMRLSTTPHHEPASPDHTLTFDELESDSCMVEILGSQDAPKCRLSRSCFKQMTNDMSEDYQLTHQLLYMLLAEMHGCSAQLERLCWASGTTLLELIDKFMIKTYTRLPSVLDSGRYDLFLEMIMVGQLFNFEEFYDPSIRELVLLWRDSTGCYNDEETASENMQLQTNHIGRKLFADELVDDTCSEHMTALALIVLSLTLQGQLGGLPHYKNPSNYLTFLVGVAVVIILFLWLRKKRRFGVFRLFANRFA